MSVPTLGLVTRRYWPQFYLTLLETIHCREISGHEGYNDCFLKASRISKEGTTQCCFGTFLLVRWSVLDQWSSISRWVSCSDTCSISLHCLLQKLNSISCTTDIAKVGFFPSHSGDSLSSNFTEKLDTLLTWAVTPLQFGPHRPFVAVTLLSQYCERTARRELSCATLHDYLFDWLDISEVAADSANLRSVSALFGKLVKDSLFDYATYIQRLVARSEPGLSCSEVSHQECLCTCF